jgi:acetoin:2,6-dichlorophenolindophenol oxidoreductase subunit alpha
MSVDVAALPPQLGDLADPAKYTSPISLGEHRIPELTKMLRMMKLIRRTEEVIADMVASREVLCPCHLAIGQEACAVGVCFALDTRTDRAFGAHRSHGHYLALGGDLTELFAEVLGRATGCSRGMGGSMHLVAPEHGLLGTVPIVGATIPMATGAGIALQMDARGGVAVAFFGDGATEEGVFHESMNLAAVRKLPVIFACENNLFSSHLEISLRQPADSISRYGLAHRVPTECLDGNDVLAVGQATARALARARAGEGPTLIEMVTYRWRGHVGHREDLDVGVQRGEHLPLWKERDPIRRLAEAMVDADLLSAEDLNLMDESVRDQVASAVTIAREAPYPEPDATTRYLFSRRGP